MFIFNLKPYGYKGASPHVLFHNVVKDTIYDVINCFYSKCLPT